MGAWEEKPYASGRRSVSYRQDTQAKEGSSTWYGIRAIQIELTFRGYNAGVFDGIFGAKTETAVKAYQKDVGLAVDGCFGPNTAKSLFRQRAVDEEQKWDIPHNLVAALIDLESLWDPGAVGANGIDVGLVQINLDPVKAHGKYITKEQAYDPAFAVPWAAKRMHDAYEDYASDLDVVLWRLAVAQHNSPLRAREWRDMLLDTWGDDWIKQYVTVAFNRGNNL